MDISNLADLYRIYGYPIVFFLVLIEGPIVTITASFFASLGYLNIFILYPVIVFSDVISDVFWYYAGYLGGAWIVERWGRLFGLNLERFKGLKRLIDKFEKNQGMVLFTAKLTHAAGFPFLIASGIFKLDIKRFILFNFLAALPKTLFFIILGYYFGRASGVIGRYLEYSTIFGIALLFLAIIIYILIQRYARKFFKKYDQ